MTNEGRTRRFPKLVREWLPTALVVILAGLVTGAGWAAQADVQREKSTQVRLWEDGSGRFLSGKTTGGTDLTGKAFCLVGWGCEDTGLPDTLRWVGEYDGHLRCWVIEGDTSVFFCDDGYVTTS